MGLTTYIDHLICVVAATVVAVAATHDDSLDTIDKVNKKKQIRIHFFLNNVCVYLCVLVCWLVSVVDVCLVDLSIYLFIYSIDNDKT